MSDRHRIRTGVLFAPDETWRVVVEMDGKAWTSDAFETELKATRHARKVSRELRRRVREVSA